ncbi:MAG: hypothetical protein Kow0077_32870 [Anaerolineae bacterium]
MSEQRPPGCDALVVTCMDFRLQAHLDTWLAGVLQHGNYDRVALAGAARDQAVVMSQVDLAVRLHGVRLIVLINHEDCGAYGALGTLDRHATDLRALRARIREAHPHVAVVTGYLKLDGTFLHVADDENLKALPSLEEAVRQHLRKEA